MRRTSRDYRRRDQEYSFLDERPKGFRAELAAATASSLRWTTSTPALYKLYSAPRNTAYTPLSHHPGIKARRDYPALTHDTDKTASDSSIAPNPFNTSHPLAPTPRQHTTTAPYGPKSPSRARSESSAYSTCQHFEATGEYPDNTCLPRAPDDNNCRQQDPTPIHPAGLRNLRSSDCL